MGRFQALHLDADDVDDDDNDSRINHDGRWEFVANEPDEYGALTLQEDNNTDDLSTVTDGRDNQETQEWIAQRRQFFSDVALFREWLEHRNCNDQLQQPQQQQHGSSRWRRRLYLSAILAVLVALWWRDPPPAPPLTTKSASATLWTESTATDQHEEEATVATTTWTAFLAHHGSQLYEAIAALGVATPRHVLYWLGQSLATDVALWYEDHWRSKRLSGMFAKPRPACVWQNARHLHWDFGQFIIGQQLAVEWLHDAIQAWVSSLSSSSTSTRERALVVVATGFEHTGKRTLARTLMQQLGRQCQVDLTRHILHLKGSDWKLEPHHDASSLFATRLYQRLALTIESHIKRNRIGASVIILLEGMEDMDTRILSRLLLAVSVPPTTTSNYKDGSPDLYALCRHAVLYMTCSSVGVKAISRNLRLSHGNLESVVASLSADLKASVRAHLGDQAQVISTILPFVPLTEQTLPLLFRRRISDLYSKEGQNRLAMTDAAVDRLLDQSRVEYLEWTITKPPPTGSDNPSGETATTLAESVESQSYVIKVVVEGAMVLDDQGPILTKIAAHVQPLLLQEQHDKRHSDQTLVLDHDARATLDRNRGVLKWCDTSSNTVDPSWQACQEALRFRI
jgi:Torsin